MPSETEVIACPACRHLVRVPADWLGQTVQCPECKAMFKAPVRDGDRLTDPQLLSAPAAPAVAKSARGRLDPMLLLPAFGLMFVGIASLIANGALFVRFVANPDGGKDWVKNQMPGIRQMGFKAEGEDADKEKADEKVAAELAPKFRWVWLAAAVVGGVVFAAGLAIALRRNYRLAQLGCTLAAINLPHLCCIPGAVFGLWGLLMLMSEEGRAHFQQG
ncbi:MAG TPA: hypothetical protein VKE74_10185 [Gemmataceae bacterium]|nr:hypothetical protein [Gemmataceae bacterium]